MSEWRICAHGERPSYCIECRRAQRAVQSSPAAGGDIRPRRVRPATSKRIEEEREAFAAWLTREVSR